MIDPFWKAGTPLSQADPLRTAPTIPQPFHGLTGDLQAFTCRFRGLTGPLLISFHSSFKLNGLVGIAYWVMAALVISGIIGRYFYAQVPRTLEAAEVSLRELRATCDNFQQQLLDSGLLGSPDALNIFHLPSPERVDRMSLVIALGQMIKLDLLRPVQAWRLRRMLAATHVDPAELKKIVRIAKQQAAISKKILFLSRARRVFHLWHVVHRPFSYTFAILVVINFIVVTKGAERVGVVPGDVRRAAATLMSGIGVGSLFEQQKVFDVVVWGTPATRNSLESLRTLSIDTATGEQVPLGRVADVSIASTPTVIDHADDARTIDIAVDVAGLRERWLRIVTDVVSEATLALPQNDWMQQGGRSGRHSEHLGHLLSELQSMQRNFPGLTW